MNTPNVTSASRLTCQGMRSLLFVLACMGIAGALPAQAASSVKAVPGKPFPTQSITASGTAFGDSEAIDVYFDTVDTLLLVSSATGTFSGTLVVPASATPGTHYVTAIGRKSGDAAQIAVTVTTPWAKQGFGSANLGFNPYENTLNNANVASLGALWGVPTGAYLSAPAIVNGHLYTAAGNTGYGIQSLSPITGATQWAAATADIFYSSPTVVGGVVYIGGNSGTVYALSATTGKSVWTTTVKLDDGIYAPLVVVNGTLYVNCTDGKVYALNATTGATLWTFATNGALYAAPAVVNGVVYAGSSDDSLYALSATTGQKYWSYATGNSIYGGPAVANGRVFIGSYDNVLYALAAGAAGGAVSWSATTGGQIGYTEGAPAVANGRVYVSSANGYLYAYNVHSGVLEWSVNTGSIDTSAPIVANGVVYVGTGTRELLALDAVYGSVLGSADSGGVIYASAAVSDGVLYFSSTDQYTYAYVLNAGTGLARPQAPAPASLHPNMSLTVTPNISKNTVGADLPTINGIE